MQRTPTFFLLLAHLFFACSGGNFKGSSGQSTAAPTNGSGTPGSENSNGVPGNSGGTTGGTNGAPGTIPTVDQVTALKDKCAKAPEASFKFTEQSISYAERKTCTFGQNSNLERKEAFVQASETSPNTLSLPTGDICSINIDSPADAKLHYDDFLILSIDSRIVFMSNSGLSAYLDAPQQGILTWDFKKIVGQKIENFEANPYCLGTGADCVLPGHDKEGPVALHLTPNEIAPIAASISGKSSVAMNLTATGDNDDTDCYHTALSVIVKIKYLP